MIDDSFPAMGDVQPSHLGSQSMSPDKYAMVVPTPANDNTNINNLGVNLKGLRDQVQQGQTRPIPNLTVIKGDKK